DESHLGDLIRRCRRYSRSGRLLQSRSAARSKSTQTDTPSHETPIVTRGLTTIRSHLTIRVSKNGHAALPISRMKLIAAKNVWTGLSLALLLCLGAHAAPGHVVAIGDVHGDLNAFVAILQRAHLVDPSKRWSGGS